MPMPAYQVYCSTKDCKNPAVYKIAARWSDGVVGELKTYGLCCEACLPRCFQHGRECQQACHVTAGETLEAPGVYLLQRGQRHYSLQRLTNIEARLLQS